MKTTFTKLFTLIALTLILAGGAVSSASAQGRLLSGILNELLDNDHCHHPSHQRGHSGHSFGRSSGHSFGHNFNQNGGHNFNQNGGHNFNNFGGSQFQGRSNQFSQPVNQFGQFSQQPVQSSLPSWLVGKWQLLDGRVGGATQYEISADGRFTTINLMTGTAAGTVESGRSTQTASYSQNGLAVGNNVFQVSGTEPGKLTLSSGSRSFQIQRIDAPVNGGQINQGNVIQISNPPPSGDGSRVPVAMHGTWYEIARNSRGEQILNRYIFSPDGTYDMLQYAISTDGDVDLGQPLGQLSRIASAQQRTVSMTPQAVMTLGAGERFAEGPMQMASTVDANGQVTILHMGDRKLTRQP